MDYSELVKKLREHNGWALNETLDAAADAIEKLQKERDNWKTTAEDWRDAYYHWFENYQNDVPKWIPVTERLPESGVRVLVMRFDYVTNTPFCDLLWFDKGEWWNRYFRGDYAVTHWMPIPEPPKEET